MTVNRQDAWTEDDDLILAEVTLRHIREGSTQLAAFEEAAERLRRTPAACGFRWNSTVRKKYETAISLAKSQRQKQRRQKEKEGSSDPMPESPSAHPHGETPGEEINVEHVIQYLRKQQQKLEDLGRKLEALNRELDEKQREIQHLRAENEKMKEEYLSARTVNEDYKALMEIMARARKMAVFDEQWEKPMFRMDANGNLERINK